MEAKIMTSVHAAELYKKNFPDKDIKINLNFILTKSHGFFAVWGDIENIQKFPQLMAIPTNDVAALSPMVEVKQAKNGDKFFIDSKFYEVIIKEGVTRIKEFDFLQKEIDAWSIAELMWNVSEGARIFIMKVESGNEWILYWVIVDGRDETTFLIPVSFSFELFIKEEGEPLAILAKKEESILLNSHLLTIKNGEEDDLYVMVESIEPQINFSQKLS